MKGFFRDLYLYGVFNKRGCKHISYEKEQKEILTSYCVYDIYTICILNRIVSYPISREETDGYYN